MKELSFEKMEQIEGREGVKWDADCIVGVIGLAAAWTGFIVATGGIGIAIAGVGLLTTSIGTGLSCSH